MPGLRRNRFGQLLADAPVLYGALLTAPSPRMVEMMGLLGFDWVLLDGEHDLVDQRACYELCTAADAVGLATMARVPANRPELVGAFADAGAHAVLVPHLMSAAGAEQLVSALRFPPHGTRGVHGGTRAANYGLTQAATDYYGALDELARAVAMVEDLQALDNLDDIAAVDGMDMFVIGPNDLSGAFGIPGRMDDQRVQAAVADAARRLVAKGKIVTMLTPTPDTVRAAVDLGARLVMTAAHRIFMGGMADVLARSRAAVEER